MNDKERGVDKSEMNSPERLRRGKLLFKKCYRFRPRQNSCERLRGNKLQKRGRILWSIGVSQVVFKFLLHFKEIKPASCRKDVIGLGDGRLQTQTRTQTEIGE